MNLTETNVNAEAELSLDESIAQAKLRLDVLNAAKLEQLPDASDEQMAALLSAARSIEVKTSPRDLGLNVKFKLNPVQRAMLGVAQAEHFTEINRPANKARAVDAVTRGVLQSFKLKPTARGLTFKVTGRIR